MRQRSSRRCRLFHQAGSAQNRLAIACVRVRTSFRVRYRRKPRRSCSWGSILPYSKSEPSDPVSDTFELLARRKCTVTEGIVVASYFGKLLEEAETIQPEGPRRIDCTTLLMGNRALVWRRKPDARLAHYVTKLGNQFEVYPVDYDTISQKFYAEDRKYPPAKRLLLTKLLGKIYGKGEVGVDSSHERGRPLAEDNALSERRKSAFWGYLVPTFAKTIWQEIGLQRHFIDDIVTPYFKYLVDIDFVMSDEITTTVIESTVGACLLELMTMSSKDSKNWSSAA